jgi:small subunit ribosomal protein S17e
LGKVRPEMVKKAAREIVERYPDKFTTDFEENKRLLNSLLDISSIRLRNRIAGYITRLLAIAKTSEIEEEAEEDEGE